MWQNYGKKEKKNFSQVVEIDILLDHGVIFCFQLTVPKNCDNAEDLK